MWDCNKPGTTLFMPVCDVSAALISLLLILVDGERGATCAATAAA